MPVEKPTSKKQKSGSEPWAPGPKVDDAFVFGPNVSFKDGSTESMPLLKFIPLFTAIGPSDNSSMGPALMARSRKILFTELERHRKQAISQEELDHPGD